jgi:hypothetical protein
MAIISNVQLDIDINVSNADITVDYDINWDAFDRASRQGYREVLRVVGDDDGVEQELAGGLLSPILPFIPVVLRSDGAATLHRHFEKTIPSSILNEDPTPLDNDAIRVRVTLTPIMPATRTAVSDIRIISV